MSRLSQEFDAVYFDLDGVLYRGLVAVTGAAETVSELVRSGCTVAYVTNNASRTPGEVASHLHELGIPAAANEVITSSQVAVQILGKHAPVGSRVFVVGGVGVEHALLDAGFIPSRDPRDCVAVVQGFGPLVSWDDLAQASYLIQGGAIWIATNLDSTIPTQVGIAPGNGSFVTAVRTAVGREPDGVGGKPDRSMMEQTMAAFPAKAPLLVGDRYDTDVAAGIAAGMSTMLVLSGVSTPADVWASKIRAGYLGESVQDLITEYVGPQKSADGYCCGEAKAVYLVTESVVRATGGTRLERLRAADSLKWSLVEHVGLDPFAGGHISLDLGEQ
ncbi:HAD-IIA family hydrolase [Actinomycetota bacterium]|nr:HAD-IIA family hydrolase [Actinomycetota bacterium]